MDGLVLRFNFVTVLLP